MRSHRLAAALLAAAGCLSFDDARTEEPAAKEPALPALAYQSGDIMLPNKVATLHLNADSRYLNPEETKKMLVAWGNPPEAAEGTQGAIVPTAVDPFADNGWAVVLTYADDGHVDDSDAREIKYDELLKDMQKDTKDNNSDRVKAGYQPIDLVGWASSPEYDATAHKLVWAKELKFGDHLDHTLNYDVRVLGREGVLSMNAVAGMSQLSDIKRDMKTLLHVAEFNPGHRYNEYNSSTDKTAAYGIGALVAGGVAAKMGLFAKLLALLVAFKKILIAGVIALGGIFAKFFKRQPKSE
jgi:uncharacterized membrane-anchored protein